MGGGGIRTKGREMAEQIALLPLHWFDMDPDEFIVDDDFTITSRHHELVARTVQDERLHLFGRNERLRHRSCKYCVVQKLNSQDETDVPLAYRAFRNFGRFLCSMRVVEPTAVSRQVMIVGHSEGDDMLEVDTVFNYGEEVIFRGRDPSDATYWGAESVEELKMVWSRTREAFCRYDMSFDRLANAMNFYDIAFRTLDPWVATMNFTIALECIYARSETVELSHSVSERAAWFLGQTPGERGLLYEEFKKVYGIRSKIAHGGKLDKDIQSAARWAMKAEDLSHRTLRAILVSPEYSGMFTNKGARWGKYLDKLVLGIQE